MSNETDSRSFERADAFDPVPVRRRVDGWTAERQRAFIRALSETAALEPGFEDFREIAGEAVPKLLEQLQDVPADQCEVEPMSFIDLDDAGHAPPA